MPDQNYYNLVYFVRIGMHTAIRFVLLAGFGSNKGSYHSYHSISRYKHHWPAF